MKRQMVWIALALLLLGRAVTAEESVRERALFALCQRLETEAAGCADPWTAYLLRQQPMELQVDPEAGTLSFSLCAWDPGVDALKGPVERHLGQIAAHLAESRIRARLDIALENGEARITGDLQPFLADVEEAAREAQRQFDRVEVRRAIVARLLPKALYHDDGMASQAFRALIHTYSGVFAPYELEAALAACGDGVLLVENGPGALHLRLQTAADLPVKEAVEKARSRLVANDYSNRLEEEEIGALLFRSLADSISGFGENRETFLIDMEALLAGDLYCEDFAAHGKWIAEDMKRELPALAAYARTLPDHPLRPQPETGVLGEQNAGGGTLLLLSAEDDGLGRYICFSDRTGLRLAVFLRSGESFRAHLPAGTYALWCAKGVDWYGTRALFGESGTYTTTEDPVTILDESHYHRIGFGGAEDLPTRAGEIGAFGSFGMEA